MKCRDTCWSTEGEGTYLGITDTSALKRGDQMGLETPVVHALNDVYSSLVSGFVQNKFLNYPHKLHILLVV